MKKFGFTLSEIIVTLGVIGVVAAVTAPLIGGIMPDSNKAKVLKVYKTIKDVNNELLSDKSLYITDGTCEGFGCMSQPLNPKYADDGSFEKNLYRSPAKYGLLFSDQLEITKRNTIGNSKNEFTTVDGLNWTIARLTAGKEVITIDIDPSSSKNCSYSENCKTPDLFIFNVDNLGVVTGNDPLTKAYLENPHKLNDRKKDYARAKELSSSKS